MISFTFLVVDRVHYPAASVLCANETLRLALLHSRGSRSNFLNTRSMHRMICKHARVGSGGGREGRYGRSHCAPLTQGAWDKIATSEATPRVVPGAIPRQPLTANARTMRSLHASKALCAL